MSTIEPQLLSRIPSPEQAVKSIPPPARLASSSGAWRSRLVRPALGVAALVVVGWAAWMWLLPSHKMADVLTAAVVRGELPITVVERGELESANSEQVVCEVQGGAKLANIVPEGTRVKKGEEVARFDADSILKNVSEQEVKWEQAKGKEKSAHSELEVQKNKEESEIAKAELALTLADIDYEAYKEGEYQVELDKRKGQLELAKKELKESEDNLAFTLDMVKKGFAQLEQVRVMELQAESKRYSSKQQEADLGVFEKFVKKKKLTELAAKAKEAKRDLERTKKSQAAATEKAINELQAAEKTAKLESQHLDRLKAQLKKTIVIAPQDGIVIYYSRPWDPQSNIRVGAQLYYQYPIFTLPDLDNMQVQMKVHESVVKKVQKGLKATMSIDALPNQTLHGTVKYVAQLVQNEGWRGGGSKEYKTEVTIEDLPKDAGLRPGMTAEVKILIKTVPDALTVPVQAVTELDGKHICYVVAGGKIDRRVVKVGESNQQLIQIEEGVQEGERVALDARLRAAAEVKVHEAKEGPKKGPTAKKESPALKNK